MTTKITRARFVFLFFYNLESPSAEPRPRERSKHPVLRLSVLVAVSVSADSPRGPRCPQRLRKVPRSNALGAVLALLGGESGRGADQRGEVGAGEAVLVFWVFFVFLGQFLSRNQG